MATIHYKITELSIEDRSKGVYALVSFWKSKQDHDSDVQPFHVNDFLFPNLQSDANAEEEVIDSIEKYIIRLRKRMTAGNVPSRYDQAAKIVRGSKDPKGLLTENVKRLAGKLKQGKS